jgi:hypothetical protein
MRAVTPEPPKPAIADLNNYFDRLDEAFASLTSAGPPDPAAHETTAPDDLDWFGTIDHDAPAAPPERRDVPMPPSAVQPAGPPLYASLETDVFRLPVALRSPAAHDRAPIAPVPIAQQPQQQPPPSTASGVPAPASTLPSIADAFSALLAAEQIGASPAAAPQWPASAPAAAIGPDVIEDVVEEVVRRVLDRLSDRVVRETVGGIVSGVAERLVREEIDRIKASLK